MITRRTAITIIVVSVLTVFTLWVVILTQTPVGDHIMETLFPTIQEEGSIFSDCFVYREGFQNMMLKAVEFTADGVITSNGEWPYGSFKIILMGGPEICEVIPGFTEFAPPPPQN